MQILFRFILLLRYLKEVYKLLFILSSLMKYYVDIFTYCHYSFIVSIDW